MLGTFLTHWTIRLALACLVVCLATAIVRGKWGQTTWERWLWTVGMLSFLAHVAAAVQFYHEWSHLRKL